MAVNMTKHDLRIFDKPKKKVSMTDMILKKETNAYINLHDKIKAKLFMSTEGYYMSEPFSF